MGRNLLAPSSSRSSRGLGEEQGQSVTTSIWGKGGASPQTSDVVRGSHTSRKNVSSGNPNSQSDPRLEFSPQFRVLEPTSRHRGLQSSRSSTKGGPRTDSQVSSYSNPHSNPWGTPLRPVITGTQNGPNPPPVSPHLLTGVLGGGSHERRGWGPRPDTRPTQLHRNRTRGLQG